MDETISDEIRPLHALHDISKFTCGKPVLDVWLRTHALRNQDAGDSRTFVLTESERVIGFYALTTASVVRVGLPGALRRNAPDPVSLMLLGQLAVDTNYTGRGLGRVLLRDSILRVANLSQHVGFRALATHPLDDDAERFYIKFGFILAPDVQPSLMVLPVRRLLASIAASRH